MSGDLDVRIREILSDCEAAVADRRWGDALAGFETLLPLLQQIDDSLGAARVHLRMGQLLEELDSRHDAGEHYRQALEAGRQLNELNLQAAALHRLGHLVRLGNPQAARELFRECVDLESDDAEAHALSLAMIGQIDFTEGDESGGLDTMLTALGRLPGASSAFEHLMEHVVYFGSRVDRPTFIRLVRRRIAIEELRGRLLCRTSSPGLRVVATWARFHSTLGGWGRAEGEPPD